MKIALITAGLESTRTLAMSRGDAQLAHACTAALNGDLLVRNSLLGCQSYEDLLEMAASLATREGAPVARKLEV